MIKSDYGHLNLPFYEQKLSNGFKVLFIPSKQKTESAILYLSQGSFLHDSKIVSSKIPFGTSYYLEKCILTDERKKDFLKRGVLAESKTDLSYTYFQITGETKIMDHLPKLMEIVSDMNFSEEYLDKLKAEENDFVDPLERCRRGCLANLYTSSPIKQGTRPDSKQSVSIHVTALKKYMQRYYVPTMMTLIVMGDYSPDDIIERIKKMKMPPSRPTDSEELAFDEKYDAVANAYSSDDAKDGGYLTYGVKFAPRANLYEKYGQVTFMMYEIMTDMLFDKNDTFKTGVTDAKAEFVSSELDEGGEDCYLLLNFRTSNSVNLLSFLADYFSKTEKRVKKEDVNTVLSSYFASSLRTMSVPRDCVRAFSKAYANNLPYTSLVYQTSKMTNKSIKEFLTEMNNFQKAGYYLRRNEDES